jgi:hypothetical protein
MAKLIVEIGVLDKISAQVAGINKTMSGFANNVEKSFATLTKGFVAIAGIGGAVAGIKSMVEAGIRYGDTVTDMSRRTGLTIEKVQEIGYVAKQSGTSIESLQKAFKDIAIKAYDNNKAFQVLGISVKDNNGILKDTGTIFQETLIKLAEIPNVTERAAIANKIFGKGTSEVMGIVGEGSERIKELTEQTKKYGLILDTNTIKSLHEASEKMDTMKTSTSILGAELANILAPALGTAALAVAKFFKSLRGEAAEDPLKGIQDDLAIEGKSLEANIELAKQMKAASVTWQDSAGKFRTERIGVAQAELNIINDTIKANAKLIAAKNPGTTTNPDDFKNPKGSKGGSKYGPDRMTIYDLIDKEKLRKEKETLDQEKQMQQENADWLNNLLDDTAAKENYRVNQAITVKRQMTAIEKQIAYTNAADTVSNLDYLASKHREFVGMYKAAAIAMTLFDTYKGAQAAFTGFAETVPVAGIPLGIAAAGVATLAGLARVQSIATQSFVSGTPGVSRSGYYRVGEQGPENVYLQRGQSVMNAINSRTENNTNNNSTVTVNVLGSNGRVVETLRASLRSGNGTSLVRDLKDALAVA